MSTSINDGGPAFPVPGLVFPNGSVDYPIHGMSLRDWFAGQALAGLMGNPELDLVRMLDRLDRGEWDGGKVCTLVAEATLKALREAKP